SGFQDRWLVDSTTRAVLSGAEVYAGRSHSGKKGGRKIEPEVSAGLRFEPRRVRSGARLSYVHRRTRGYVRSRGCPGEDKLDFDR
ncbi:MAG: hypothetical protein ACK5AN_03600, partial [Planctomyces sp.]